MLPDYKHNDGGRSAAGYKGAVRDCGVRAAAIALGESYDTVYNELFDVIKQFTGRGRRAERIRRGSPRKGLPSEIMRTYMASKGWKSVICKSRLDTDTIPRERALLRVRNHYMAMIDNVVYDIFDNRMTTALIIVDEDGEEEAIPSKPRMVYEYFVGNE